MRGSQNIGAELGYVVEIVQCLRRFNERREKGDGETKKNYNADGKPQNPKQFFRGLEILFGLGWIVFFTKNGREYFHIAIILKKDVKDTEYFSFIHLIFCARCDKIMDIGKIVGGSKMQIDKVAWRAVVSTLCAIAVLCLCLFLVGAWAFPPTMMKISYETGNDKGAMKYAYRAYKTTGELHYLGFATRVAMGINDLDDVDYYGSALVASEGFEQYCLEIDEKEGYEDGTYELYISTKLVVVKYSLGEKDEAKEYAFNSLDGGFPQNNAVIALLFSAMQAGDTETESYIVNELRAMTVANEVEQRYLNNILEAYDLEK